MDDFAFELEILDMDGDVEFSFGVQDRSCDVDVHIGNGIDSSLVKAYYLIYYTPTFDNFCLYNFKV